MPPYRVRVKVDCFTRLARRKEGEIIEVEQLDDRFELLEDLGEDVDEKPAKKSKAAPKAAEQEPGEVFG